MQLDPPADKSIITLWLGNIEADMTEADIRAVIYPYGQIASFHLLRSARCAFVEYIDREAAEGAAAQLYNALTVNGRALSVNWAKPRAQSDVMGSTTSTSTSNVMPPPPGMEKAPAASYVLPGLPVPVVSWPTEEGRVEESEGSKKRPRVEDTTTASAGVTQPSTSRAKYTPAPPRGPPPSSAGLLAGLSAYGDDSDEDPTPVPRTSTTSGKSTGVQYPSMNPARMGSAL